MSPPPWRPSSLCASCRPLTWCGPLATLHTPSVAAASAWLAPPDCARSSASPATPPAVWHPIDPSVSLGRQGVASQHSFHSGSPSSSTALDQRAPQPSSRTTPATSSLPTWLSAPPTVLAAPLLQARLELELGRERGLELGQAAALQAKQPATCWMTRVLAAHCSRRATRCQRATSTARVLALGRAS